MNVILLRCVVAVWTAVMAVGAFAQVIDESALDDFDSRSPVRGPAVREAVGAVELRAAMRRIADQPNDADALADAGNAALTLGDANAALNFLTRANALRPRNGRITSALASATVRTENPFEALRLFDEAVRLGASERSIAADRALAFDLLGNFARAQQDYRLARSASMSDDLVVRQAVSLSLLGQTKDADGMLLPLLQKNDPAAWRARAFILAARGETRESTKVTQGFMDARSAQKMERYLRLMPDLTGAQKAAAIHLGHFPAYNIGRDSAEIKRLAANSPAQTSIKNNSRLIPTGEPLGQKSSKAGAGKPSTKADRKRDQDRENKVVILMPTQTENYGLITDAARIRVKEAQLATAAVVKPGALPPPETARSSMRVALPSSVAALKVQIAAKAPGSTTPATTVVKQQQQSQPMIITPSVTRSISTPVSQPSARPFDLAAIVGAIDIPADEQKPSAVPVDLNKLKWAAAKAVAADSAKIAKLDTKAAAAKIVAANPARYWVQIAAGRAEALGFDYRRWQKKAPDLFKGKSGWTSQWGKTDRLLVGPFGDLKASKKWEADFNKAGGDAFAWKSENGVVVTALKGK